jgi:hypothetical protein
MSTRVSRIFVTQASLTIPWFATPESDVDVSFAYRQLVAIRGPKIGAAKARHAQRFATLRSQIAVLGPGAESLGHSH